MSKTKKEIIAELSKTTSAKKIHKMTQNPDDHSEQEIEKAINDFVKEGLDISDEQT
jgi:hypothetical protein